MNVELKQAEDLDGVKRRSRRNLYGAPPQNQSNKETKKMYRAVQLAIAIGLIAGTATSASAHSTGPKVKPTPAAQQVLTPGEMSADMKAVLLKQGWPNVKK